MKSAGVLFVLVLFFEILGPVRTQALQLDCPFPEGSVEWQDVDKKYVCKFATVAPAPPPAVQAAAKRYAPRQTYPVIVQRFPTYPSYVYPRYPFWGGTYWGWGGTGIYYGPSYFSSTIFGGHHYHSDGHFLHDLLGGHNHHDHH